GAAVPAPAPGAGARRRLRGRRAALGVSVAARVDVARVRAAAVARGLLRADVDGLARVRAARGVARGARPRAGRLHGGERRRRRARDAELGPALREPRGAVRLPERGPALARG